MTEYRHGGDLLNTHSGVIVSALYLHPDDTPERRDLRAKQEVDRIVYKGGEILTQRVYRDGPGWCIETEWSLR